MNKATTFVSSTHLRATIPASDADDTGMVFPITVQNPGPVTSNTAYFLVDFTDVAAGSVFHPFVKTVALRAITAGCGFGNYCPTSTVTRDQMAVFLLRADEGPTYTPPACAPPDVFSDVPTGNPFCPWVEELFNRQVTAGCSPGLYCPFSPVTRGSMSVSLLRCCKPNRQVRASTSLTRATSTPDS